MQIPYQCPTNFVYARMRGQNFRFPMTTSPSGLMTAYLNLDGWTAVYATDKPSPVAFIEKTQTYLYQQGYALLLSRVRQVLENAWETGHLRFSGQAQ